LNGGSGAAAGTYTIEDGGNNLPVPTKVNYDFAGWYANSDLVTGGAVTGLPTNSTGNLEFWAKWTETDALILSKAKALIEKSSFKAPQASAGDEATLKTWLATEINTLLSGMGITTIIDNDISIKSFAAATAGNASTPAGTDGSFRFTVQLTKGSDNVTTDEIPGVITATPYVPTGTYAITIGTTSFGTVTADKSTATPGELVTLTATPAAGYEFDNYSVYKTDDVNTGISVLGNEFTMPSHGVTVTATFQKTFEQQAVEAAQTLIENGTYIVAQATANTSAAVKTWLEQQISGWPEMSGITVTVTMGSSFTPASGATASSAGTPGSFNFTAVLSTGTGASATTASTSGSITPAAYVPAPNYVVTVAPATGGSVTASPASGPQGATVKLTISPFAGYELNAISASQTGGSASVTLSGSGLTRTFTMPAYHVTVTATFQTTADQQDVSSARSKIESATFSVPQATANTSSAVRTWLVQQINSLIASTGVTVSASDITVDNFTAAVAGTAASPSGTNGSYRFTVSLAKNGASAVTSAKTGQIVATAYAPAQYAITIGALSHGRVTANVASAPAGATVTLTVTPDAGYELDAIRANITGIATPLSMSGSGNTRTFIMPANAVTVTATFKKTQVQIDKETVEEAKVSVEGGTYRIAQATGNTDSEVKTWLTGVLNLLLSGRNAVITFRSGEEDVLAADVTLTSFTAAIGGTAANPSGTNGSYRFTVVLSRGSVHVQTLEVNGVIVATPYAATPVKRIEVLSMGETRVRIINTGNTETGALTLSLSGASAGVFTLPSATAGNLLIGGEADFTLVPREGLTPGAYTVTVTVGGDGLTTVSLEITYHVLPVGNEAIAGQQVWAAGGTLYIAATATGEARVFSTGGQFVKAIPHTAGETVETSLPQGVYIVVVEEKTYKVVIR
ncbi:MAG: hypothetical protein LBR86_04920, partial [Tannerella sp.]|jgi:uncharacterized repeat protein (TIGR02543 family)|nr:hypothetical protein [Tannerella sp.]